MFSLLDAKYNKRSVKLLKLDFLFRIIFLIFSELLDPPGSLSFIYFFFFLIKNFSILDVGCLTGHFLFSFKKRLNQNFHLWVKS